MYLVSSILYSSFKIIYINEQYIGILEDYYRTTYFFELDVFSWIYVYVLEVWTAHPNGGVPSLCKACFKQLYFSLCV